MEIECSLKNIKWCYMFIGGVWALLYIMIGAIWVVVFPPKNVPDYLILVGSALLGIAMLYIHAKDIAGAVEYALNYNKGGE